MAILEGIQEAVRAAADAARKAAEAAARERAEQAARREGQADDPTGSAATETDPAQPQQREAALRHAVRETFADPPAHTPIDRFFQRFEAAPVRQTPAEEGADNPLEQLFETGERIWEAGVDTVADFVDRLLPDAAPQPHDPVPLTPAQEAAIEARVTEAVGDPTAISDTDRQELIAERHQLLTEAYTQAESTGDARLLREADELAQLYRDREVLALSRALGTSDAPHDRPPEGWHEASPTELAQYGLTPENLRDNVDGEGFNAELYIPDPEVFGPDARPVLAFEGTDFGDSDDVNADVAQAFGREEPYYREAMKIATLVHAATGGDVQFTGHSLGGGLATAAALVTGAPAVVSNPAGVHPDTVADFLAERNLAPPADADADITTYVVDGDILTGLQNATDGLSAENADGLATVFNGAVTVYNRVTGAELPTDATGEELRDLPDAAGRTVTLPAVDADGEARPEMLTIEQIFDRVSRTADVLSLPGEAAESGGGILGGILDGVGDAADWVLDTGGSILGGAGGFLEWADRYLPGDVASGLGEGLEVLGDGYDSFGDVLDNSAEAAAEIARETGRDVADVNRDLAIAAGALIETLGATEVTWTRLPSGQVVPVPTANEVVESVFEGVQRHKATVAYEAMDYQIGQQETAVRDLLD